MIVIAARTDEAFKGEVERTVYDQIVDKRAAYFLAQAAFPFGTFSALLP